MDVCSLTFVDWILFAALGRLLLFVFMKSPYCRWIMSKGKFFDELFSCTFCSGFWMYWIFGIIYQFYFLNYENVIKFIQIVLLEPFLLAAVTSYIVWLFETGFRDRFTNIIVKGG
jgi:hypothetical protein